MARIIAAPPRSTTPLQMKEDEPYQVQIKAQPGGEPVGFGDFGYGNTMFIDWQLEQEPDIDFRDFVGLALGSTRDGRPARLRQILNAIGNQPRSKEIAWFDDETLEWSYDGEKAYARLEPGDTVIIRGENIEKQTKSATGEMIVSKRFVITGYRPAGIAQHPADNPTARQRPAVVKDELDPDEIPF